MLRSRYLSTPRCRTRALLVAAVLSIALAGAALGHPLGNFTINHFSRIELDGDHIRVRFVVDMAEISTLQELQAADTDGTGCQTTPNVGKPNALREHHQANGSGGCVAIIRRE